MWYDITPTNSNAVQNLRATLQNYGNDRIRVLPCGEPDYETEHYSYRVSHEWSFFLISEMDLQEDNWGMSYIFKFSLEGDDYSAVNYGLWSALAELSDDYIVTGNDVIVNDNGSLDFKATVRNILSHL